MPGMTIFRLERLQSLAQRSCCDCIAFYLQPSVVRQECQQICVITAFLCFIDEETWSACLFCSQIIDWRNSRGLASASKTVFLTSGPPCMRIMTSYKNRRRINVRTCSFECIHAQNRCTFFIIAHGILRQETDDSSRLAVLCPTVCSGG